MPRAWPLGTALQRSSAVPPPLLIPRMAALHQRSPQPRCHQLSTTAWLHHARPVITSWVLRYETQPLWPRSTAPDALILLFPAHLNLPAVAASLLCVCSPLIHINHIQLPDHARPPHETQTYAVRDRLQVTVSALTHFAFSSLVHTQRHQVAWANSRSARRPSWAIAARARRRSTGRDGPGCISAETLDFNCLTYAMDAESEGAPRMNSYLLRALCTGY